MPALLADVADAFLWGVGGRFELLCRSVALVCHTFLNNTAEEVRLLVVGERPKPENRIHYPMNPDHERTRADAWTDVSPRDLDGHDGKARAEDGS
jgi:uncharacterized cupin superfamily protein